MSKHFIIDPTINSVGKEYISMAEKRRADYLAEISLNKEKRNEILLEQEDTLKWVHGRVVVKANLQSKNYHTFEDGTKIRRERQFNELNRRITEPVNAIVISAEDIPTGAEILISHNAFHDSNAIFNYKNSSESADVRYFSIAIEDCYAWRTDKEYQPVKNIAFGLRVYQPYEGIITSIDPTLIKDILYITTGELKGNVVHTLKASDYEVIYQGLNGREDRLIRCRHFEDDDNEKEEIIAINHHLTIDVKCGRLLVGYSVSDCKPINLI